METIYIASLEREITLLPRTRKISREINTFLFHGVAVEGQDVSSVKIPFLNMQNAEEHMVKCIAGLSQEQIDRLTDEEYENLKVAINARDEAQKKTQSV